MRKLRAAGHSYRDIGEMLGMSYQRAHQIATDKTVGWNELEAEIGISKSA